MPAIESILFAGSILLVLCVALTRFFHNLGIPVMLLFIGVGLLAGPSGPGGMWVGNAELSQSIGIVCLALILFAGGLETDWRKVRPVLPESVALATIGVGITAGLLGLAASWILDLPPVYGMLLGSVLSSTDASAVFSVLRMRDTRLRGTLRPLLELESGINDPMAVFLTIGCVEWMLRPDISILAFLGRFVYSMAVGGGLGVGAGLLMTHLVNRLRTPQEGLYPVFTLAWCFLVFGLSEFLHASGFLAVFLCGLTAAHRGFVHHRSTERFFNGLAWLGQIVLFLVLGFLLTPSHFLGIAFEGAAITALLIVVARPLGVWLSLLPFGYSWREVLFLGWVGLRGAVPIVLAMFPLIAGVTGATMILDLVFFAVIGSAVVQGTTIPAVARLLRVAETAEGGMEAAQIDRTVSPDAETIDFLVPFNSWVAGRPLVELNLPEDCQVVLLSRGDEIIIPSDGTVLEAGDSLELLVDPDSLDQVREILSRVAASPGDRAPAGDNRAD